MKICHRKISVNVLMLCSNVKWIMRLEAQQIYGKRFDCVGTQFLQIVHSMFDSRVTSCCGNRLTLPCCRHISSLSCCAKQASHPASSTSCLPTAPCLVTPPWRRLTLPVSISSAARSKNRSRVHIWNLNGPQQQCRFMWRKNSYFHEPAKMQFLI